MLNKIKALWAVFKVGGTVADPQKWKARQVSSTVLAAFIIALVQLAKAFNVDLPIDNETATAIAGGLVAFVNVLLTLSTSKKIGVDGVRTAEQTLPSVQQPTKEAPSAEAVQEQHASEVAHGGNDSEVCERDEQWAKHQSANGLRNDA